MAITPWLFPQNFFTALVGSLRKCLSMKPNLLSWQLVSSTPTDATQMLWLRVTVGPWQHHLRSGPIGCGPPASMKSFRSRTKSGFSSTGAAT